ncbi:MAG: hypothetical protein DME02_23435 [Candidatus Rokuibacteriota bacterium]|nr:MAG: hypothetical protein DME02_23435 [Candidatus Rokubacteria bacterium]
MGVLALATAVAWGDVGHANAPDEGTQVPRVVWLLGIALTILVGLLLLRQARRGGDYLRRVRGSPQDTTRSSSRSSPPSTGLLTVCP